MSGGAANNERFEQVGQSNVKHAFTALTGNICGLGCNGVGGANLGFRLLRSIFGQPQRRAESRIACVDQPVYRRVSAGRFGDAARTATPDTRTPERRTEF